MMNDHIAKPINIDEMFATLARWISPGCATPTHQVAEVTDSLAALPGPST